MWFLNRLEQTGEGAAYNTPLALRLTGEVGDGETVTVAVARTV